MNVNFFSLILKETMQPGLNNGGEGNFLCEIQDVNVMTLVWTTGVVTSSGGLPKIAMLGDRDIISPKTEETVSKYDCQILFDLGKRPKHMCHVTGV